MSKKLRGHEKLFSEIHVADKVRPRQQKLLVKLPVGFWLHYCTKACFPEKAQLVSGSYTVQKLVFRKNAVGFRFRYCTKACFSDKRGWFWYPPLYKSLFSGNARLVSGSTTVQKLVSSKSAVGFRLLYCTKACFLEKRVGSQ